MFCLILWSHTQIIFNDDQHTQNNPEFLWLSLIFPLIFPCYSEFCLFQCTEQRKNTVLCFSLRAIYKTFSRSNNFSFLPPVSSMFQQYLYSKNECEPGIKKFMFSGKLSVEASEYIMEHITIFKFFHLSIVDPVIFLAISSVRCSLNFSHGKI